MKGLRRFFGNAFLLTVSALIMRSISVSFGAYVSNTAGAEAMGLFSLIMSVFGFALTLATSGINLAVTRMVSEALAENDDGLVRRSIRKCLFYCIICSFLAGGVLFIFAEQIGDYILKDTRTIFSLRVLAATLPFISITAAFNGYFTAVRRVYKNTIYQISEQLIKMYFTVKMFELYIDRGIEYACIALVVSDAISEFSAFIISGTLYYFDRKKHIKGKTTAVSDTLVTKKLCSIAIPVALSTYIRSGLLTIEHILIPRGLTKSGAAHSVALAAYGTLSSMVMPIIFFPTAILSSFASLLVPELAEAAVQKKKTLVQNIATRAFRYSLIFSFGISGILITFSGELGMLIYESTEVSRYISLLAPLVPVMYLDSVTDAMLKGLGQQVYSMNVNIFDALLSIILVIILLPNYGIFGYIITIYITELANAALSILRLISITDIRPRVFKWVFAPLISVLGSSAVSRFIFGYLNLPISLTTEVVLNACLMLIFYFAFIRFTGAMSRRDYAWFNGALKIRSSSAKECSRDRGDLPNSLPLQRERLRNIRKC
ncbi:MAG: oligosaccharide flippase family protein [Clostridia bacterium]|nr:oligosaccharide flippase family protein [Clostridia bacterium]